MVTIQSLSPMGEHVITDCTGRIAPDLTWAKQAVSWRNWNTAPSRHHNLYSGVSERPPYNMADDTRTAYIKHHLTS